MTFRINEPNLQVRVRRIPDGIPDPDDLDFINLINPVGLSVLLARDRFGRFGMSGMSGLDGI